LKPEKSVGYDAGLNPTGFLAPGLGVFGGIRVASYGVK
jgi:hypothetical protein